MIHILKLCLIFSITTNAFAQDRPTLSDIKEKVRAAYEGTNTIQLAVSNSVVEDFDAESDDANIIRTYRFASTDSKFYLERNMYQNESLTGRNVYTWDGKKLKGLNTYPGSSSPPQAHSDNKPDYALSLSAYPLPWDVLSPKRARTFYWFNSPNTTLLDDTVMIDGHECYVIITDDPVIRGRVLKGNRYRTYIDATISFMPRRVEKMDSLNLENVLQQKCYKDYQKLKSGLWLARRIELEGFRRSPDLPTRKNIIVVVSALANQEIAESQFELDIAPDIHVYNETKFFIQQRMMGMKHSPLTRPIIVSLVLIIITIGIMYIRHYDKQR